MMNKFNLMLLLVSITLTTTAASGVSDGQAPVQADRSRCVISAGGSTVNYGVMSRWQLQETYRGGELTPGIRTLPVTVACAFTQDFRMRIAGNSSTAGEVRYGNNGWLKLRVNNLRVDGRATGMVVTSPAEGAREAASGSATVSDGSVFSPCSDGQKVTGRTVTFDLIVEPRLSGRDTRVGAPTTSEAGIRITLE